jgi:hypothetical protein
VSNLKDKIKAAEDQASEMVPVPEWDVTIEIRSMTAGERAKFMGRFVGGNGNLDFESMYPACLIATAFDPDTGELLFDDTDVVWLKEKNGAILERLAQKAMEMSGLDEKAVDRAGKDSSSTSTAGTSSSSPSDSVVPSES